jgi:hypothetical protein
VTGAYTPQPPNRGPGGAFELRLKDTGQRGPSSGDTFSLTLHDGIYDGYHNEGVWIRGSWRFIKK